MFGVKTPSKIPAGVGRGQTWRSVRINFVDQWFGLETRNPRSSSEVGERRLHLAVSQGESRSLAVRPTKG